MSKHPSLDAPFLMPPELNPREKMPVNSPCWCGSDEKWKNCHRNRETQEPIPMGKSLDEMRQAMTQGYCLHPDASKGSCGTKIIKAHTIQRNGGLADVAEDGHVISFKRGFEDIIRNDGKIVPREIGVRHASTFMGFCSPHDDALFAPVEKAPIAVNPRSAFLLSYRAMSYELYQKEAAFRSTEILRKMDKGKPFPMQVQMQNMTHFHREGLRRGLEEMKACKATYDEMYRTGDLTGFSFYSVLFSSSFPVVACGGFMPEFDVASNPLQAISHGSDPLETVFFNLSVVSGKSLVVFGHTDKTTGPAAQFVQSFANLPKGSMANTSFHVPIEYLENTYLRPSWWHERSSAEKEYIIRRVRTMAGASTPERKPDCLTNLGYQFASANVELELQG